VSTIKVSKATLKELESLRESMGAKSIEDVIKRFIKERRSRIVEDVFGIDKERLSHFKEEDRGEDRG
jgi:predicted CopG family antitoxin